MLNKKALAASVSAPPAPFIEDVFSTYLYSGNASTQTISNDIDLSTKGGLVWLKERNLASSGHVLFDTARSTGSGDPFLQSNSTGAQIGASTNYLDYLTNGFTLLSGAGGINASGINYCSWTFREQPKFFDVVTYTGTGSAQNISHSLGSVPGFIITKNLDAGSWWCFHRSLGNATAIRLNSTAASNADATIWNSTTPTSTQFTVGASASSNDSGATYVAYLFAHNAGGFGTAGTDNVISCGSFTTDGAGNFSVDLGYEPQYVLIKAASGSYPVDPWYINDVMRGFSKTNAQNLVANSSAAESATGNTWVKPNASGFATDSTGAFAPTTTYIYMAIRRPMKVPTTGTEVFSPITSSASTGTAQTTGFPIDLQFPKDRSGVDPWYWVDRLRGVNSPGVTNSTPYLRSDSTTSESVSTTVTNGWNNTGFNIGGILGGVSASYCSFRRASGFFDVVCWTGAGGGGTLNHNLTVVPELIIWKARSNGSASWFVYSNLLTNPLQSYVRLNANGSRSDTGTDVWTTPTTTQFGYTSYNDYGAGTTYVAYLFATLAGVSKVFSYTGNGSSQTINCAFTAGARLVLIKRTDSTGDWYVWDTARGIVSGNDPHLSLNTTAAEVTSNDSIDPDNSGFIVNQLSATNINVSSATYIGIAVA